MGKWHSVYYLLGDLCGDIGDILPPEGVLLEWKTCYGVTEYAQLKTGARDNFDPPAKNIDIGDILAWRWPDLPFEEIMSSIRDHCGDDSEQAHILMDDAMCNLLDSLGYEDGVKIFKNTPKYYS